MAGTEQMETNAIWFEYVLPILTVQNLQASIDYYVQALGFTLDWIDSEIMARFRN